MNLFNLNKRRLGEHLTAINNYLMKRYKEDGARFHSEQNKVMKQVGTQEILSQKEKQINTECGHTPEQAAQRGCGISILGDIQNSAGDSPEQLVTLGHALSEALDNRLPEVLEKSTRFYVSKKGREIFLFFLRSKNLKTAYITRQRQDRQKE